MLSYEDARATVMAASRGEFDLPEYTGAPTDLAYLKQWVLNQVTVLYSVSANIFDDATLYSTSVLRDFVHRAIYDETGHESIDQIAADGDLLYPQDLDIAPAFRYPAYGLCGLVAWQEYQVFRAFGYQATDIATFNASLGEQTDSHVMTEVFVTDLSQFIIQDATYNLLFQDGDGNYLSFEQARNDFNSGSTVTPNSFDLYWNYPLHQIVYVTPDDTLKAFYAESYFDVPYWKYGPDGTLAALTQNLFPNPLAAHDPTSDQGETFGTIVDAQTAVTQLTSLGWVGAVHQLQAEDYYASGFALATDTQDLISHWITVRLDDGDYVSFDIDHNIVLNGSYDQLAAEATGGPIFNPNADLSIFLKPAYLIDRIGAVEDGFVPTPGEHVAEFGDLVLRNANTGMVKLWDEPDTSNLNMGAND